MLGDAIEYPVRGEDAPTTILVGGLLPLLAILLVVVGLVLAVVVVGLAVLPLAVVPGIVLLGYYVAVLRAVGSGETDPPRFRDWRRLFADGLRHLAISVAYAAPLVVLAGLFLAVVAAGGEVEGDAAEIGVTFAAVVVGGLAACYLLAFAYVRPLALANFAREERFGAAFDLETIRAAGISKAYALAWLLAVLVWFVGATLEGTLSIVLVGFFVGFYADVVRYHLYGRGLRAALGETDPTPSAETARGSEETTQRSVPRIVLPEIEEYDRFAARTRSIDRERGWADWETDRRE
ncbi:DUF4013 domain-containing protein [Halalkalicoccus salilacus]|uniref:DUF4013 domain-containing protein n=1 Tax=Halalkalicoccus salilacus TaxID=3117459 RepID=UPI00300F127B